MPPSGRPIQPIAESSIPEAIQSVCAAPNRKQQLELIAQLARHYQNSRDVLAVYNQLSAAKNGHRLAMLFVALMPLPIPTGLLLLASPLLQARDVSVGLRITVAARIITCLPDRAESIGPIVRALTAGLGKTRTLERLIQLQSRVERSTTLDEMVESAEKTTRLKCPKCNDRFSRPALIRHLWHKHQLIFENGTARDPAPKVEEAVQAAVESHDPDAIDHVYAITQQVYAEVEPRQIHQAILARSQMPLEDAESLIQRAAREQSGLCPVCFHVLPPSLPPLPDPLVVSYGRLVGEGYCVEARPRAIAITYADGSTDQLPDPSGRSNSREFAARVGAGFAAVSLGLAAALPSKPLIPTIGVMLLGLGAYTGLLYRERRVPKPDARAVNACWSELVPTIGRSARAIRFLTRLCRASLGQGEPEARSKILWEIVEHSAVLAQKGPAQTQWFATARLLQAHDSARIGKEWINQLLAIWEPFFSGSVTPVYAETIAEILIHSEILSDRDSARLRVQLPALAFDSGFSPSELNLLAEYCPNFSRVLAGNADWFHLLHELWKLKNTQPWEKSCGPAQTIFELTRKGSQIKKVLAYPDTLLIAESPELGDVLIGRRGVTIADCTVADPEANISTEVVKKGATRLNFGSHRIVVEGTISERTLRSLRGWLNFRSDRLMPAISRSASAVRSGRVVSILESALTICPMCQSPSLVQVGGLGRSLQASPATK